MSQTQELISPQEIAKSYQDTLAEFSKILLKSMWASTKAKNINAGERCYWGSVLFTRIAIIGTSILTLCPGSELSNTINWDFGSVASLVRNLHECSLMFFYLSIDPISVDEWRARLNIMQLHDNSERRKMFGDLSPESEDSTIYTLHDTDLKQKLLANPYFLSLPDNSQKKLLKGESPKILTHKEISDRMGNSEPFTWGLYRFFSCHTHTTPLSFYRLGEQRRIGVENDVDKGYKTIALDFANQVLSRTLNDFVVSFSGLVNFDFASMPNSLKFLTKKDLPMNCPSPALRTHGRNEPCHCGSGKKYKRCHGF